MAEDSRNHCKICFEPTAKYMCPQCGISYCSSNCYRNVEKHLECSEAFYRRCVKEELQSHSQEESKKKMEEILQRHHNSQDHPPKVDGRLDNSDSEEEEVEEEEELDSDDDEPLEKRLNEIDLEDSEKVWDMLTAEEKDDFLKMVNTSEKQGVEPVAEPWYPGMKSKKLVEEND